MNRAILFLSHLIPNEHYEELIASSKGNMQDAANALQWHLLEGFNHHLDRKLDVINFLPISSFPRYYKKAFIKEYSFDTGSLTKGKNIGFCNIQYIRRTSIIRNLKKALKKWCRQNIEAKRTVIVYTLNSSVLSALASVAKKYEIEVCAVVADLPDMLNLSSKKSVIKKIAEKILVSSTSNNLHIVDKFVFLTEQMSDYLNNNKPFCVMEGIATDVFKDTEGAFSFDKGTKTVLYTGTLHRKFGILNLLDAFLKIDDPDYRLVICGVGDSEERIRAEAEKDKRIIFKGQCPRGDVLKYQQAATVLVNPRQNNEEFTKYSFPSKNMEYLSSGTPLIAYKLDGIPEEYGEYINYVSDDSADALADMIKHICDMPEKQRNEHALRARDFVMNKKNSVVQTGKIIDLINS